MGKKSQKSYLADHNFMIAQHLWQVHYQILLIILLKEFIKLNGNMDMIIKKAKRVELKKDCEFYLEYINVKDDLVEYKCLCSIFKEKIG